MMECMPAPHVEILPRMAEAVVLIETKHEELVISNHLVPSLDVPIVKEEREEISEVVLENDETLVVHHTESSSHVIVSAKEEEKEEEEPQEEEEEKEEQEQDEEEEKEEEGKEEEEKEEEGKEEEEKEEEEGKEEEEDEEEEKEEEESKEEDYTPRIQVDEIELEDNTLLAVRERVLEAKEAADTQEKDKQQQDYYAPPIAVVEYDDSFHIYAEVHGVEVKDVRVNLSPTKFTLSGAKKCLSPIPRTKSTSKTTSSASASSSTPPGAKVLVDEIGKGRFKRVLDLPPNLDMEDMKISCEEGMLSFKIRKLDNSENNGGEGTNNNDNSNNNNNNSSSVRVRGEGKKKEDHKKKAGRSSCAVQ